MGYGQTGYGAPASTPTPPPSTPNLQGVTDVGNTTTNDLVVSDGVNTMRVEDSALVRDIGSFETVVNFTNPTANRTQTHQDASGTIALLEDLPASATASGTNTYAATLSPAITAYDNDLRVWIRFTNANTGASTLNLNGLGARTIVKNSTQALIQGDIIAGQILNLAYDGTNFQVVNPVGARTVGLGNTLFVSTSAPVANNSNSRATAIGRIDLPFQSLASAIAVMASGDTIVVYSSTISESVNFSAVASASLILINSTIIGAWTGLIATSLYINMQGNSGITNCNLVFGNQTLNIQGGTITNSGTGINLQLLNTTANIEGVRFVNTSTGTNIDVRNGNMYFNSCRFRSTSATSALLVAGGGCVAMFDNCKIVSSGTGVAVDINQVSYPIFNNCYIRANSNHAVFSGAGGVNAEFNNCEIIANANRAIFSDADNLGGVFTNCFIYGVDVCFRGTTSSSRITRFSFYNCRMYATTGEIFSAGEPSGVGTKCLVRNTDTNKAITALQIASTGFVVSNANTDTTMTLPNNLTLLS